MYACTAKRTRPSCLFGRCDSRIKPPHNPGHRYQIDNQWIDSRNDIRDVIPVPDPTFRLVQCWIAWTDYPRSVDYFRLGSKLLYDWISSVSVSGTTVRITCTWILIGSLFACVTIQAVCSGMLILPVWLQRYMGNWILGVLSCQGKGNLEWSLKGDVLFCWLVM